MQVSFKLWVAEFFTIAFAQLFWCTGALAKGASPGAARFSDREAAEAAAFVEWNPAAIKDNTIAIAGEYLVIDGVSFGTLVKVTDRIKDSVAIKGISLGGTLTQYFFSPMLHGPFVKGDVSLFGDQYKSQSFASIGSSASLEREKFEESGYVYGASLGLVAGYRFMFTDHITGSAGYGVVRNLPEFFGKRRTSFNGSYFGDKGDWRFDVLAGIGVSF